MYTYIYLYIAHRLIYMFTSFVCLFFEMSGNIYIKKTSHLFKINNTSSLDLYMYLLALYVSFLKFREIYKKTSHLFKISSTLALTNLQQKYIYNRNTNISI